MRDGPGEWRADPTGRHPLRWWEGGRWTDKVWDGEAHGTDPFGPPPAAPPTGGRPGGDEGDRRAALGVLALSGVSFLLCPGVGHVVALLIGRRITTNPRSRGPLVASMVTALVGLLLWTPLLAFAVATTDPEAADEDGFSAGDVPSSTTSEPEQAPVRPSTTAAPATTVPPTTAPAAPRPPTTSAAPAATTGAPAAAAQPRLTGFGATRAAWDASHTPAPGRYTKGSAYGPMLDGKQPTYAAVVGDEHIIAFTFYAPARTSLRDLQARVRREFPPDARLIDSYDDGSGRCRIESYKSELLERAIGSYTMVVAYPSPEPEYEYRDAIFGIGQEGERDFC